LTVLAAYKKLTLMKSVSTPTPQSESEQAWLLLCNGVGNYFGTGINHEKKTYESTCRLTMEVSQKLISVRLSAIGMEGEIFHDEVS